MKNWRKFFNRSKSINAYKKQVILLPERSDMTLAFLIGHSNGMFFDGYAVTTDPERALHYQTNTSCTVRTIAIYILPDGSYVEAAPVCKLKVLDRDVTIDDDGTVKEIGKHEH